MNEATREQPVRFCSITTRLENRSSAPPGHPVTATQVLFAEELSWNAIPSSKLIEASPDTAPGFFQHPKEYNFLPQ
jgi:hypothetical protein